MIRAPNGHTRYLVSFKLGYNLCKFIVLRQIVITTKRFQNDLTRQIGKKFSNILQHQYHLLESIEQSSTMKNTRLNVVVMLLVFAAGHMSGSEDKCCHPVHGPSRRRCCLFIPGFNDCQWTTCQQDSIIRQISKGRHRCMRGRGNDFCHYQCMLEMFNREAGNVDPTCLCNANTVPLLAIMLKAGSSPQNSSLPSSLTPSFPTLSSQTENSPALIWAIPVSPTGRSPTPPSSSVTTNLLISTSLITSAATSGSPTPSSSTPSSSTLGS